MGLAYGSEASVELTKKITCAMQAASIEASVDLAHKKEPFAEFDRCRESLLSVLKLHQKAVEQQDPDDEFWQIQRKTWLKLIERAEKVGVRNSQWTLIAPTGTIGLFMDCDTLGIEPEFSLMKTKSLAGGGVLTLINSSVEPALQSMGLENAKRTEAIEYLRKHHTLEGCVALSAEQQAVFSTAVPARAGGQMLRWQAHLDVMAAAQPFLSGAISKTVNLSSETSTKDIAEIYMSAWKLGLKSVAIYREGSKGSQPLNVKSIDSKISKRSS
ncbi:MAG: vitamin B12-dependent ribonucleotide reductase, partial [Pseudomonadota bacterium]